jgi:hypothetical protein
VQIAWKVGLIALVALGFALLPGGESTLSVILTLLSILFFAAIAFLVARLFREYRFSLDSLSDRERLVLYGAIGLALLTFIATNRLFDSGGFGVLAWFALLGAASYALYWVWTQFRSVS